MDAIVSLIEQVFAQADVGTLFLGKGQRVRQVFFSGEDAHLLAAGKDNRIVPVPGVLRRDRISGTALAELFAQLRSGARCAALTFQKYGLLDDEDIERYATREVLEELLWAVEVSGEHYLFEPGNVPESLLLPAEVETPAIASGLLVRALRHRLAERRAVREILPRFDEVLVLSERGMAAQHHPYHWHFAQVAALVDGFRTVHRILDDCPFFPQSTLSILTAAARQGWIKKTLLREVRELDVEKLGADEARQIAPYIERSLALAVDALPLRELLVELCYKTDDAHGALVHLEALGDGYAARANWTRALACYERCLQIETGSRPLREKVFQILLRNADQALHAGDLDVGRKFLEQASRYRKDSIDLYVRIVESYGTDISALSREALRLFEVLLRDNQPALAQSFLEQVVQRFPTDEALRRRYINFLLDRGGSTQAAVRELETLAHQLLGRGETLAAQDIHRKILRLCPPTMPSAAEKPPVATKLRRRHLQLTRAGLALCLMLGTFGAYQQIVYIGLERHWGEFKALAESPIPTLGTPAFEQEQQRSRNFLEGFTSFQRRHVLSIWSLAMQKTQSTANGRVQYLDYVLNSSRDRLKARANRAFLYGQFDEARELFGSLAKIAAGTRWEQDGRDGIRQVNEYLERSEHLLKSAQLAEARLDYEECFEIGRQIILDYPRSRAAKLVRIPVAIESRPVGARVLRGDEILGITPLVVLVDPFKATTLRVDLAGHRSRQLVIDGPVEHHQLIELRRN
ncbi:MAG: hypothetical protein ACKVX7_12410 [Planctomycetota bacterium]